MSLTNLMETSAYNPLDNVERMATTRDWAFDRSSDDEVTLVVAGEWAEYQLSFTWMSEIEEGFRGQPRDPWEDVPS